MTDGNELLVGEEFPAPELDEDATAHSEAPVEDLDALVLGDDDEDEEPDLEELYGTDPQRERQGVWVPLGKSKFLIAAAGGANADFQRAMASRAMPHRRQLQRAAKNLTPKLMRLVRRLEMQAYADAVVLNWENVKLNKQPLPYSRENVLKLFQAMPRLFDDIREYANDLGTFQNQDVEDDAKN